MTTLTMLGLTKKSDIREHFGTLLAKIKGLGFTTTFLRCDNAAENVKHLSAVFSERGITMEMTAPYTPQMNGVVEISFVTARDRAFAMLISERLSSSFQSSSFQNILWVEAVHPAPKIGYRLPYQDSLYLLT